MRMRMAVMELIMTMMPQRREAKGRTDKVLAGNFSVRCRNMLWKAGRR